MGAFATKEFARHGIVAHVECTAGGGILKKHPLADVVKRKCQENTKITTLVNNGCPGTTYFRSGRVLAPRLLGTCRRPARGGQAGCPRPVCTNAPPNNNNNNNNWKIGVLAVGRCMANGFRPELLEQKFGFCESLCSCLLDFGGGRVHGKWFPAAIA